MSEFLNKSNVVEENENKILGFLGYLGWLGCSVATLKQAVFSIKDGHKKSGMGDPTEKMYRVWMLLTALEKRSPKKPRCLGVTPDMLLWVSKSRDLENEPGTGNYFDAVVLSATLQTAWFFMMRAKEYSDSSGIDYDMIVRGADFKFLEETKDGGLEVAAVTMQFHARRHLSHQLGSTSSR